MMCTLGHGSELDDDNMGLEDLSVEQLADQQRYEPSLVLS